MKPTLYVVANAGLDMSTGKLAAQAAHATVGAFMISSDVAKAAWGTSHHRWAIILRAEDEMHLLNIKSALTERSLLSYLVNDEGANEVRPFSLTALGVEILDKDDPVAAGVLGRLKTYPGKSVPRATQQSWVGRFLGL